MDLFTKGWECPKCGAVMSPTTSVCINCTGHCETTVTTNLPRNGYGVFGRLQEVMDGKGEGE